MAQAWRPSILATDDERESWVARLPLLQIGGARGERELALALRTAATKVLGARDAKMLSRSRERPRWKPLDRSAAWIGDLPPRLVPHLRRGTTATLDRGEEGLESFTSGDDWQTMVLQPCSGPESEHACLFFQHGRARPNEAVQEVMEAIALVTGLTLDRIDAVRREQIRVSGMENQIRNVVALIRSVSERSAQFATSIEDFIMHFDGRIDALARSQLALARSAGNEVDFELLLREELLAHGIKDNDSVKISGMPIDLGRREAEMLMLGVHELAVNSVKFGVMFHGLGSLAIRWWTQQDRHRTFNLTWQETGLFGLEIDDRAGFGRLILEKAIPYELGGGTDLRLSGTGMHFRLSVPIGRGTPRES